MQAGKRVIHNGKTGLVIHSETSRRGVSCNDIALDNGTYEFDVPDEELQTLEEE